MGTTDISSVAHRPECTEVMCGGPSWIRTSEGVSQQIYSLPRLATSVSTHTCCLNNEVYYTVPKIKCQTEICRFGDGVGWQNVVQMHPKKDPNGALIARYPTGDAGTTNICFGGLDRRTAFVTLGRSGQVVSMQWHCAGLALAHKRCGGRVAANSTPRAATGRGYVGMPRTSAAERNCQAGCV